MSNRDPTTDLIQKREQQVRLYAHWLDGEWSKIAYPVAVTGRYSLQCIAERTLKLHALFGTRIAISDIQLTDSPAIALLFANPDFRKYLSHDSGFLTLVSHTREAAHSRFALATSGLHRASEGKHWATSFPGISNEVIRSFAESVLSLDSTSVAYKLSHPNCAPRQIIKKTPIQEHQEILEGILEGIRHFTRKNGGPSERAREIPRSYMEFLEETLGAPGLPIHDYDEINKIRSSVIELVGEEHLKARSSLIRVMETKEPDRKLWNPKWHRIWNTVVHTWNSNVARTVGARESIAPLPDAVIPFRGAITDVTSPFTSNDGEVSSTRLGLLPGLSFDPDSLTWANILEIVSREDIHGQREVLRCTFATQDSEEIAVAAKELVHRLKPLLIPHPGLLLRTIDIIQIVAETSIAVTHLSGHGDLVPPGVTYGSEADFLRRGMQSFIEGYKVWNTLSGFKRNLISVFDAGKSPA